MQRRRDVMLGAAALWPLGLWAQPSANPGAASTAAPAEYPRPGSTLRLVVPFAAGSLTDVIARLVQAPLGRQLGLRVDLEQQPGEGGQAGAAAAARAAPDGYTLVAVTLGHAATAAPRSAAGGDVLRQLKPVALLASSPIVAVVPAASRLRSAADLLATARSSRLTAASSGNGTPAHLTLALFNDITRASVAHRPLPGGSGAIDAVLAGQADLMFADLAEALPHLESGRLRALAIAGVARHPRLADVPTTAEVGLPTLLVENWTGLMAPKQTADLIVDKLDSELVKIMLSPEVGARAAAAGLRVDARPAGRFAAFLDAEVTRWGKLIGAADLRVK